MAQTIEDLAVDVGRIEKELAELWRAEQHDSEHAVTKAALWNVIAHTWTSQDHAQATEVLARSSASVPQRTIIVHADPHTRDEGEIASWISANCHLVGGGHQQVCSEEVSIVASGTRVHHVPPLVKALLLPDMPVAVWWVGDLPNDRDYVETLLDPADRLIVDSAQFNHADDLELVSRIAEQTTTAPADLNWARIEEWRAATAAVFDPPAMRERLQRLRKIVVSSGGSQSFGDLSEALLYVAWMWAQSGVDVPFTFERDGEHHGIRSVEIHCEDGSVAAIRRDGPHGVVIARSDGTETELDCVTRALARKPEDLIVRLLKRPEADRVYLKALKVARRLAS